MAISTNSKLRNTSHRADLKLFIKDVSDMQGRKRPINVRSWSTIKDVKDLLQQLLHVTPSEQRLFYGPLMSSGGELPNHRTLHDAGIYRSGETVLLEIKSNKLIGGHEGVGSLSSISSLKSNSLADVCISSSFVDLTPKSLRRIIQQARRGFAVGLKPELILDGSGGSYFLHEARKVKIGVFKPSDEEPYAENNPRGYRKGMSSGMVMREGIQPGEACLREVAAFLLDQDGFSGVPMTTLIEAKHQAFNWNGSMLKLSEGGAALGTHSLDFCRSPSQQQFDKKVGSFQQFISSECSMDDLSPNKLTVDEVHKIAILDIRIMNADRHPANLLCRRKLEEPDYFELIPIDHGFCLGSVCEVCEFDWCWLEWPQLKKPLSKKSKKYVLKLDVEKDIRLLSERLFIPSKALDYFRASTKLLQAGVRAGLNLYEIATLCCRLDPCGEKPSKLEEMIKMATDLSTRAVHNGRWHHSAASRALAEQLSDENMCRENNALSTRTSKSKSSVCSTSFEQNISSISKSNLSHPPMTHSSGSDSSSDPGDNKTERDECGEWAAATIADITLDVSNTPMTAQRQRGVSFGSSFSGNDTDDDDSSRSSTSAASGRFWFKSPNSKGNDTTSIDDVSWTPHTSPSPSPRNSPMLKPQAVLLGVPSLSLPPQQLLLPPMNTIRKSTGLYGEKTSTSNFSNEGFNSLHNNVALRRIQSYSAFSFKGLVDYQKFRGSVKNSCDQSLKDSTEQFQIYFFKFIDLLITRQTTTKLKEKSLILNVKS